MNRYPFTAWRLLPSFKPVEVELVKGEKWFDVQWSEDASGKSFRNSDLFGSKELAIKEGRSRLQEQQVAIDKKQANINKRLAVLDKAAMSLNKETPK